MQLLATEKESRTEAQSKVDSNLLLEIKKRRNDAILDALPSQRSGIETDREGFVIIDIEADIDTELLQNIVTLGGSIINSHPRFDSVRARLLLDRIEALAELAQVRNIRPALPVLLNKTNTTQGDVAHRADTSRPAFAVDGSGVQVGALSDSVDSLAALQASGDLPAVTVLSGQSGATGSSEGTAMLEIVHDLAPGADLFFATALGGSAQFAQNIIDLAAAGCDVIVDDVFYLSEPVFQDGIIAQAVNTVTATGVQYYSSAGNSGNRNDGTSGVWEGDFVPIALPDSLTGIVNLDAHDFGNDNPANTITVDAPAYFILQWSDPQDGSANDYDLYLLNPTLTAVIASSTNIQNGNDDPFEAIDSRGVDDAGNKLVIVRKNSVPAPAVRYLHLNSHRGRLEIATNGQTSGHSAAAGAFSVAAVRAPVIGSGQFTGGTANPVETFSSDGPRRIFYHADGTPVTPGNFLSSGGSTRQKPDLAAADGVATATPGFNPFFGTSAAAPHAAALGALLLDLKADLTPLQIRRIYQTTALDIEAAGIDQDSGAGIIMADAVLAAVDVGRPAVTLTQVADITVSGGTSANVTVTYRDDTAIDASSIDIRDIRVSGLTVNSVIVDQNDNGGSRTATYRIDAPGGNWNEADNASYTVTLQAGEVLDNQGNPVLAATLSSFDVDIDDTAPTASLRPISDITASGGNRLDVIITYSDNRSVDVGTIDINDIQIAGLTLDSFIIDHASNGTSRTVAYRFTPPGGIWNEADNGSYTVDIQPNQVRDIYGNAVAAAGAGNFAVDIDGNTPVTVMAPGAVLTPVADIHSANQQPLIITVTYSDDSAIDASTLDAGDIRVNNAAVSFIGVDSAGNGTSRTASYRFSPPGGRWDAADNGTYQITMQANQVGNTGGHFVAPGQLGSFSVGINENRLFSGNFETP